MDVQIPHNINDLSQKGIMNLFQDKELSLFGFKIPKMVESLNVELQNIKIEEKRTDLVFLLEDGTLLHLEFQTTYRRSDLTRFMMYDLLLYEQHKQRKVTTIVIYASGVTRRKFQLDFSTLSYYPYLVFLEEVNGDEILQKLEDKLHAKEPFNDEDFLNLLFNFFMKSGILEIEERAIRLLKVAGAIEEPDLRNRAISTTYGIAGKFLTSEQMMKLDEVFKMTDPLVALIKREGAKEAAKEVAKEVAKEIERKSIETAKNLLDENVDIDLIARATKLSTTTIKELQLEI